MGKQRLESPDTFEPTPCPSQEGNWTDSQPSESLFTLLLTIADTGIGIPVEQQERIFAPFEQAKQTDEMNTGGTGLGLTITRRLVDMMGGENLLESAPGQGATFRIILHDVEIADEGMVSAAHTVRHRYDYIVFEPATILIADDVEYNRELIAAYLDVWEFRLLEAKNGEQAVQLAQQVHLDLILLDMKMPLMDGYEATERLRADEEMRHILVVAVTASALQQDEEEIAGLCDGYLRKPFSQEDLLEVLTQFLPFSGNVEPQVMESADTAESLKTEEFPTLPVTHG